VEANDISDEQKARICKKLGEADKVNLYVALLGLALDCKVYWKGLLTLLEVETFGVIGVNVPNPTPCYEIPRRECLFAGHK